MISLRLLTSAVINDFPMSPEIPLFVSLSHLGLLQLQGPDTNKFLQGQVTNDVNRCTVGQWQHNSHCTPKGRMVANFDSVRVDEHTLLLRLPKDTQAALQTALGKYIVFSKAKLTDVSDQYTLLGLCGNAGEGWLQQQLGLTFADGQTVVESADGLFVKLDAERIECWLTGNTLPQAFTGVTLSDDTRAWRLRDIQLGRGWVAGPTIEEFLPQLLNLQTPEINAISFKKGCYTGQEIVARMHYKGKLKRHMYLLGAATAQEAAPGADVYRKDKLHDGSLQSVGSVVNAVTDGTRTWLLAVVADEDVGSGQLVLNPDDQPLELLPQPYPVAQDA